MPRRAQLPYTHVRGVPIYSRWTPKRKAKLIEGIAAKQFSREDLLAALAMSPEELGEWLRDAAIGVGAHKRQPIDGRKLSSPYPAGD